jgi:hypothetical protein
MRPRLLSLAFVSLAVVSLFPARASAQQAFSFHLGGFVPRGEDSRASDDALFNNLFAGEYALAFDLDDFNGPTVGGEWLFELSNLFEAGLGAGYYRQTVSSVYANRVKLSGEEIEQDLRLRIVPLTATVRFTPLSRRAPVRPYFGAGVGIFSWRYSETGEFVDTDETIFGGRFVGTGWAAGPVVLGGLRVPIGEWDLGFETRYQQAEGELPFDEGFLGTQIDLGGFNYLATFAVQF